MIANRLRNVHLDVLDELEGRGMKAYYMAHVIETHACWPRVLDDTMELDRFFARTKRMMDAILRVTSE